MKAFVKSRLEKYYDTRLASLRSRYDTLDKAIASKQEVHDCYWQRASFERHGILATEAVQAGLSVEALVRRRDEVWSDLKELRIRKRKVLGWFEVLRPAIA